MPKQNPSFPDQGLFSSHLYSLASNPFLNYESNRNNNKFSLHSSPNHHRSWLKLQLQLPSLIPRKLGYKNAERLLFWGLSLKKSPEKHNNRYDRIFPNDVAPLFDSYFYST